MFIIYTYYYNKIKITNIKHFKSLDLQIISWLLQVRIYRCSRRYKFVIYIIHVHCTLLSFVY